MKQFFKNILSSCVGIFFALILFFIVAITYVTYKVSSVASSATEPVAVDDNSVLKLNFDTPISERENKDPLSGFNLGGFGGDDALGLMDIVKAIKIATNDDKIKGIYLESSGVATNLANVEEIRNALIDFKKSKKFIWAYNEMYSQTGYYLCSVADSVWLNPVGMVEMKGMASQVLFFKGALSKLEIEPEIIRHGKFKSAVEPLISDKLSDANRLQIKTYLGSLWNHIKQGITQARKLGTNDVQNMVDNALITNAKSAQKYKLVDRLLYKDQVLDMLVNKLGVATIEEINTTTLQEYIEANEATSYASLLSTKNETATNRIAVVYANGDIESGKGDDETIGSDRIAQAIREARLDEKVKALVLRVNSPGGSSMASDIIWREVLLTKKVKPVVVSMGGLAASGGYYIACCANKIIAEPTTITGSIGVFGVLWNGQGLLNNKLGITVDTVKTGRFADIGTTTRALTATERAIIQQEVETIYDDFITRVAEGRGMTKAQVDSIGQGRVWAATDAKRIGLVDELGGMDKAIETAAQLAKMDSYTLYSLPKKVNPFDKLMKKLGGSASDASTKTMLGDAYPYYKALHNATKHKGILMRTEYDIVY
jgi:protease IV